MNPKTANIVLVRSLRNISSVVALQILRILRNSEFSKYFFVSLLAFVLDLAAFSVSLRIFALSWAAAATLGFVVGLLVAYVLSVRFVFVNRKLRKEPLVELLTFSMIGLGGLGVTQLVLWVCIESLKITPEISKFFAAGITFLFNFWVRKLILFSVSANSTYQSIERT